LQSNVEIVDRLVKTLGKRKEVLEDEALAAEKKDNPANFGPGCERFCPCELPGQLPCPAIIPVPKKWRGKYHYHKYQDEDQEQ
jgi:small subunit ribosomal protein S25